MNRIIALFISIILGGCATNITVECSTEHDAQIQGDAAPSDSATPDASPSNPTDAAPETATDGALPLRPRTVSSPNGDFWLCNENNNLRGFGFQGCCTNGHFQPADHAEPGTLIKGTGTQLYYVLADGRRAAIASTAIVYSWFTSELALHPDETFLTDNPSFCPQVIQISDDNLASMPIAGNVTLRSGSAFIGISSDSRRYLIGRHGSLHMLTVNGAITFPTNWSTRFLTIIPDWLFVNYSINYSVDIRGTETPDMVRRQMENPSETIDDLFNP